MNEGEVNQLQKERALGEAKQAAFDTHVEPFISQKRHQLFEAFCKIPAQSLRELQVVRLQVSALDAIEADFQHYINTGKMASITLDEKGE